MPTGYRGVHRGCSRAPQRESKALGHVHSTLLAAGCTVASSAPEPRQAGDVPPGVPGFYSKLEKECFGPGKKHQIHRIHRPVPRLSHFECTSHGQRNKSIIHLSGHLPPGLAVTIQDVLQVIRTDSINPNGHSFWPVHGAISAMVCSAGPRYCAPLSTSGFNNSGVRACSASLETHGFAGYGRHMGTAITSAAHVGTQTYCVDRLSPVIGKSHARPGFTEPRGGPTVQRHSSNHLASLVKIQTALCSKVWL